MTVTHTFGPCRTHNVDVTHTLALWHTHTLRLWQTHIVTHTYTATVTHTLWRTHTHSVTHARGGTHTHTATRQRDGCACGTHTHTVLNTRIVPNTDVLTTHTNSKQPDQPRLGVGQPSFSQTHTKTYIHTPALRGPDTQNSPD